MAVLIYLDTEQPQEKETSYNESRLGSIFIKACIPYCFIKILFFQQMTALQNLRKMFFISSKKLFWFSRYSNFCNFFPSSPQFPDSKGQMEVE